MRSCLMVVTVVAFPFPLLAARIVSLDVEQDGKVVLRGSAADDGLPRPPIVWRYLKSNRVQPVEGFVVQPEAGRPLEAVLRGNLRVNVQYGADVRATELRLTRESEQSQLWLIDPAWVESNAPPGDLAGEIARVGERQRERSLDVGLSLAAVGLTSLGLLAGVVGLGGRMIVGRRLWARRLALTALVFCGLALAWGFISEDRNSLGHEIIRYAAGVGVVLAAVAVALNWRIRLAERVVAI